MGSNNSAWKNNLITLCGLIEMVFFSGVIFGWANMVLILKGEGYFKDLCLPTNLTMKGGDEDEESHECSLQDDRLTLVFTIAVFCFHLAGFGGGVLFDTLGTRIIRLISCLFFFLAGLFAFFLDKGKANLIFAVIVCLAVAGMFVAVSLFQIPHVHPKRKLIVSSSLIGALHSSAVVFFIFKVLYELGITVRWILITYTATAIVWVMTNTFVFMPKKSFALEEKQQQSEAITKSNSELGTDNPAADVDNLEKGKELKKSGVTVEITNESDKQMDNDKFSNDGKQEQTRANTSANSELGTVNPDVGIDDVEKGKESENSSVPTEITKESRKQVNEKTYSNGWRYMLTPKFLWLLFYLAIIQLRLWFFVGSLNRYLEFHTDNDKEKIDEYTNIFGIVQFFGFVFALFAGFIMEIKPKNTSNPYFGPMLCFIITNVICVLLGSLVLVPVLEVQYLSFVTQVALRAFVYASHISFILRSFPAIHCGKLYGVCITAAAVFNLFQYPAFIIMDGPFGGDPFWVNFCFLILSFTGFGLPLYLWISNRKKHGEVTTTF